MTRARINDAPLKITPEVGWKFTSGVEPYQRRFWVSKANAKKLAEVVGDVTLTIEPDGKPPLVVQKLSILAIEPTNSPYWSQLLVSDRRWLWPYEYVIRTYNLPRRTSDFRRLAQEGVAVQVQQVLQEISYARWTLYPRSKPASRWTSRQVLDDVLEAVCGKGAYKITGAPRDTTVIGAHFDEDGTSAVSRALAMNPGSNIRLDQDGTAIVYDELNGAERDVVKKGSVFVGSPLASFVDLRRRRPRAVWVLFDREVELKFEAEAEGTRNKIPNNLRELEMVLPIPNVSLVVNGVTKATGTWERFDDWLGALGSPPATNLARLSHSTIQQLFLVPSFLDYYARPNGVHAPNVEWANNVGAVLRHYRQTYRINKVWMDMFRAVYTDRVGILDPTRGTRARAQVFTDYGVISSVSGAIKRASEGDTAVMWNVPGYASAISSAKASAPCEVGLEDGDAGVLRLEYRVDAYGDTAKIVPCSVVGTGGTIPSFDLRKAQQGRGEQFSTAYGQLKSTHQLAIILTVTPGAPNDERTCHREVVLAREAERVLGIKLGQSDGPVFTIRVAASKMTALHEWTDDKGSGGAIDEAFGITPRGPEEAQLRLGDPSNKNVVRDVALAAAAALYSTFVDRIEGQHVTTFNPQTDPDGRAQSVEHKLAPNGVASTTVSFPTFVHGVDILSLLPGSVRDMILRTPRLNP